MFIAAESIHFQDSDYLRWSLKDGFHDSGVSMKFRFKTVKANGVIYYTKLNNNILTIEIVDGRLRVAAGGITDGMFNMHLGLFSIFNHIEKNLDYCS